MNRMRKNKCGSIGYAFGVRGSTSVHLAMREEIVNNQISLKMLRNFFTWTSFQNAISKSTNFLETFWNVLKLRETLRNFVLKLSLGTSCHFKNLKTFYLYSQYTSRSKAIICTSPLVKVIRTKFILSMLSSHILRGYQNGRLIESYHISCWSRILSDGLAVC